VQLRQPNLFDPVRKSGRFHLYDLIAIPGVTVRNVFLVLVLSLFVVSCGEAESGDANTAANSANAANAANGKSDGGGSTEALCVGVRGNGPKIFAHFAGMARIHEHYGPIVGVAGGSSGSITSFLTESFYANPALYACGDEICDDRTVGLRVALMFKSLPAYVGFLSTTEEALAFQTVAPIVARAREQGVGELIESGDAEAALDAINTILESEDLRDLVNPEVLELLNNSPDTLFHLQDLWASLQNFGTFAVDSDRIFVRPGFVSFEALAEKFGRIGSFYAGYGAQDAAQWQAWFEACAPDSYGKGWNEIAALDGPGGVSCGDAYFGMLTSWREDWVANEASYTSRIDDRVGVHMTALVSTSVLTGDAVDTFVTARDAYRDAAPYSFDIDFDDVRFGYWGQEGDLRTVAGDPMGYGDEKTSRFYSLGQKSWREALSFSPAEPGLERALEIDALTVSAGGWSDLAPTLVLKNVGCDKVVLITREGEVEGGFGPSVAAQLGMDAATNTALYDLDGESSVRLSLEESDATLCTNWDGFGTTAFEEVFANAYTSPLETTDPYFTGGETAYSGTVDATGKPACTPGVPAP
jgi:hypothetical protein